MENFIAYREAGPKDIKMISTLVLTVFNQFVGPGYSKAGQSVFGSYVEPDNIVKRLNNRSSFIIVALYHQEIVGTIEMKNGNHISLLFVHPEYQRLGIARKLILIAIQKASKVTSISEITVNSSPYAVDIYKKLGFQQLDQELEKDGIKYVPMKKYLLISVGKLAKIFGISRTTLLYYDSIGLLKPAKRNESGYRLYEESDLERLKQILVFREVGLSLEDISSLLSADNLNISAQLFRRLKDLNSEIENIRSQQDIIVKLLKNCKIHEVREKLDRDDWIRFVEEAGIEQDKMMEWHSQFEKSSPEQHDNFLKMLNFSDEEIKGLKKRIKNL